MPDETDKPNPPEAQADKVVDLSEYRVEEVELFEPFDPSLLLFVEGEPPRLDIPGILGEDVATAIEHIAKHNNTAAEVVAMYFIGALSGLIGNSLRPSETPYGWNECAVIWPAVVAEPGDGKTPALNVIKRIISKIENEHKKHLEEAKREYEKYMIGFDELKAQYKTKLKKYHTDKAKGRAATEPAEPVKDPEFAEEPIDRELYIVDASPEATVDAIAASERGIQMIFDELSGFLGSLDNSFSNNDPRSLFKAAYQGDEHKVNRIGRGNTTVKMLTVAIWGGIQPEPLSRYLAKFEADGLYERFDFFYPDWPEGHVVSSYSREFIAQQIDRLYSIMRAVADIPMVTYDGGGKGCRYIHLSERARHRLAEFVNLNKRRKRQYPTGIRGNIAKAQGRAMRWALLRSVCRWASSIENVEGSPAGPGYIGLEDIEKAIEIVDGYLIPHTMRAYNGAWSGDKAKSLAREIATYIAREKPETVNFRELRRKGKVRGMADKATREEAITMLCDYGWIAPSEQQGHGRGGHNVSTYIINPKITESR